ncbi:TPA: hypothetical protein MYP09_000382 [Citrobacter farmeri]|nr:hypothetical protein [Citrobacter farmeri]
MSNKTGGPAFPYSGIHKCEKENLIVDSHGMTLRDYFAAKAMQGWLASYGPNDGQPSPDTIAAMAYRFADGMIKAREAS